MVSSFSPHVGEVVVLRDDIHDLYVYVTLPEGFEEPPQVWVKCLTTGSCTAFDPVPVTRVTRQSTSLGRPVATLCAQIIGVTANNDFEYIVMEGGDEKALGSFSVRRAEDESSSAYPRRLPIRLRKGQEEASFKLPWMDTKQWKGWAWVKSRPTWIEPQFQILEDLPSSRALHVLLLHRIGRPSETLFILPVSTAQVFTTLSLAREGEAPGLYVRARRGDESTDEVEAMVHIASDDNGDVESLTSVVMEAAMQPKKPRSEDTTSPFNLLGFCTWSALGEFVLPTRDNLLSLVDVLRDQRMPIGTFVLDDGWQDIKAGENGGPLTQGLWGFGAYEGLQRSLSDTVSHLKTRLPTLKHVGVWLSIQGYWDSITPSSPLIAKYDMQPYTILGERVAHISSDKDSSLLKIISSRYAAGRTWYLPHPTKVFAFWYDYFSACYAAGITFVKVDNQASISMLSGPEGAAVGIAMWDGMFNAAHDVFGSERVIHCMAHHERTFIGDIATGNATGGAPVVFRATNDFGLCAYTQPQHIQYNVLNALVLSKTNLVMDADMFMTKAKCPEYHAVLRAYSHGPLLLSDHPGEHDMALIGRLVGRKRDNPFVVTALRSATPLVPLPGRVWETGQDCLATSIKASTRFADLQSAALIIWSRLESSSEETMADVLHKGDVIDALRLSELAEEAEYLVWSVNSKHAERVTLTQREVVGRRRDCYQWADSPVLAC